MTAIPATPRHATLRTLGWAIYLACSWTWCIGMFLPVLMVRDFGFMGWAAFAAPNIIGAAAMGWVLSRPGAAQRIVATHTVACQCFSAVTIAFHCFFVAWVVRGLVGPAGPAIVAAVALALWLLMRRGSRELALATIVFAISLAMIAAAMSQRGVLPQDFPPLRQGRALLCLSPVLIFGFALCPYLDLTFLRARSMTEPRAGVAAFTLGFGFFFLLMILFTLWYAPLLQSERFAELPRALAWIIAIHMMFQSAFTIALHARPLTSTDTSRAIKLLALVLGAAAFILPLMWTNASDIIAAARGERVYRLFMSFYGLLFPAYVWLCMIPTKPGNRGSTSRRLIVLTIAVLIAAPMFWLGFIAGQVVWLVPGFAVVLLSRLLITPASATRSATPERPATT